MSRYNAVLRKARKTRETGEDSEWRLQDAKAQFSEVFRRARSKGPQKITRHGKEAVVMLPAEDFERLSGRVRRGSLVEFFATSPLAGSGIDLERVAEYGRDLKL